MYMRAIMAGVVISLATPVFAETEAQKSERCSAQAGIVAMGVTQRKLGTGQTAATETLMEGGEVEARYAPSVPMLVEWVYTLDDAQLTPEAAQAFEKSCLTFQQ